MPHPTSTHRSSEAGYTGLKIFCKLKISTHLTKICRLCGSTWWIRPILPSLATIFVAAKSSSIINFNKLAVALGVAIVFRVYATTNYSLEKKIKEFYC